MAEQHESKIVLVTGASGFIATHVVQQLQQLGYKVRGTVRSLANEQKVKPLRELCPGAKHEVELVEADLTSSDGWQEAVRGCTYVIHTASPFPKEAPLNESELIKPAVEGTLAVLVACRQVGCVKRVVLTSSVAAVSGGTDHEGTYDEKNWTNTDQIDSAYSKSKTLAEKAAWDFVSKLYDTEQFELTVMNPCYVMGPVLSGGWATSMELPKKLLERAMPALPHISLSIVDVRDVAAAHIAAMTLPDAAGKRHILSCPTSLWFHEIAKIYSDEFYPLGYNVPVREAPYFLLKLFSFFDKTVRMILPLWGVQTEYNNTRMTSVLGVQPRPVNETIIDMAYSMIEKGLIKKTKKYIDIKENK
jgi:nucleoside-diphosphate-sugar epimerase